MVAAGNGGNDHLGDDNDTTPTYPCVLPLANVLCVGASDELDQRALFSNYGHQSVDLFAPGVTIVSTWDDSTYRIADGTSMASPEVAATAALVLSANPSLTTAQLKQVLIASTDHLPWAAAMSVSGGRLNALSAVTSGAPNGDIDADGVPNSSDDCLTVKNPNQSDIDHDGIGDACDPDQLDGDGDGVANSHDNCPRRGEPDAGRRRSRRHGRRCDSDRDGDGIPDLYDNCPGAANKDQKDTDRDGAGDACEAAKGVSAAGRLRLTRLKLWAKSPRACLRGCHKLKVTLSASRKARVKLVLATKRCKGKSCRWATLKQVSFVAKPGSNAYSLRLLQAPPRQARLTAAAQRREPHAVLVHGPLTGWPLSPLCRAGQSGRHLSPRAFHWTCASSSGGEPCSSHVPSARRRCRPLSSTGASAVVDRRALAAHELAEQLMREVQPQRDPAGVTRPQRSARIQNRTSRRVSTGDSWSSAWWIDTRRRGAAPVRAARRSPAATGPARVRSLVEHGQPQPARARARGRGS